MLAMSHQKSQKVVVAEAERLRQAESILSHRARLSNGLPHLLVGDLNAAWHTKGARRLLPKSPDSLQSKPQSEITVSHLGLKAHFWDSHFKCLQTVFMYNLYKYVYKYVIIYTYIYIWIIYLIFIMNFIYLPSYFARECCVPWGNEAFWLLWRGQIGQVSVRSGFGFGWGFRDFAWRSQDSIGVSQQYQHSATMLGFRDV